MSGVSEKREAAAFSEEERDQLVSELQQLRERRDQLASGFEDDRDTVADSGDAADAIQRAANVAAVDDRIRELNWLLEGGISAADRPGTLPNGTELTVRLPSDKVVHLRVVAVVMETPAGEEDDTLTAESPLGLALVGRQPGDKVTYSTPQGQEQVELLSIEYPP